MGALALDYFGVIEFTLKQAAAATGIIGGADGPTAIYVSSILSTRATWGNCCCSIFIYGASTTYSASNNESVDNAKGKKRLQWFSLRVVSQSEKNSVSNYFTTACWTCCFQAHHHLLGMLCLGNLMKESLVVDRLSDVAQNSLINIVTIFLGLAVGSKLAADKFLTPETLGILILGMVAFAIGTASGVLGCKAYEYI